MNIAICDDDENDLNNIKEYVSRYNPSFCIYSYISSKGLLNSLNSHYYDVIFLDIEMDEPNGYETAKLIKAQYDNIIIVFTTNSLEYAIRGYGIAFRYLPKPISYELFLTTITQIERLITPQKIDIQTSDKTVIESIHNIIYFESYGHTVIFHITDNRVIESRITLNALLDKIKSTSIVQIHKSYCINLEYVSHVTSTTVQLNYEISLPISRSKRDDFRAALHAYIKEA